MEMENEMVNHLGILSLLQLVQWSVHSMATEDRLSLLVRTLVWTMGLQVQSYNFLDTSDEQDEPNQAFCFSLESKVDHASSGFGRSSCCFRLPNFVVVTWSSSFSPSCWLPFQHGQEFVQSNLVDDLPIRRNTSKAVRKASTPSPSQTE
jgi:hypothetical protein